MSEPDAIPDLEAEELAAKHNISVDEAKRLIAERGHDRGAKDEAAQETKLKPEG